MQAQMLLDTALQAERFVRSLQLETPNGVAWGLARERPEKVLHTLYAGSAGIILFYLELARATGEARFLDVARAAGTELLAVLPTLKRPTCAPMGGWVGYMFVLHELAAATGEQRFADMATRCAAWQRDLAEPIGAGIGWVQEMPYAKLTGHEGVREIFDMAEGAAGAAVYWLYAHEKGIHPEALTWATSAGRRLLEVAEAAEGGRRWQLMPDIPWPFDAPNFAHGTAGVAYCMARLYECTGDAGFLEAALAGAGHVQAMAESVEGGGHLVPHILDDGRPSRFYLGVCHGPPGTGRLFVLLNRLTGESRWADWGRGLDDGLMALGAPEQRGRGFWNNVSQCCCDAGIGDHAVNMYRRTGDTRYLDLAQRVAAELIRRSDGGDAGRAWPQAEHRTQPDFIQAQTGYMQGAAGIGSFFVHLATTLRGEPVKIQFPDSPF